jgi:hypothetical protein
VPAGKLAAVPAATENSKPRELAPVQQLIADEVAEILAFGGTDDDVTSLLWAALANMHRRYLGDRPLGDESPDTFVNKMVTKAMDSHKAKLSAIWRQNRRAEPGDRIEPKTLTACIRANVIEQLRDRFASFLAEGTPEEHRIMLDILSGRDGNGFREDMDELSIAREFDFALGKEAPEYVKVPSHMRATVDAYIKALKAANVRDAA